MGVSFCLNCVEGTDGGGVRLLDGAEFRCADDLRQLPALLDPVSGQGRRSLGKLFPWYFRSFDWNSGRSPTAADCVRPKDVLAAVHAIERELQRSPKRFPAEWRLWQRQPDGTEAPCQQIVAFYRGKRCRLFTDDQGAWAVETESPMAYPVHYPLSDLADVCVSLEPGGPPVAFRIEARSPLAVHEDLFAGLKRVCLRALERNALVLPSFA